MNYVVILMDAFWPNQSSLSSWLGNMHLVNIQRIKKYQALNHMGSSLHMLRQSLIVSDKDHNGFQKRWLETLVMCSE